MIIFKQQRKEKLLSTEYFEKFFYKTFNIKKTLSSSQSHWV